MPGDLARISALWSRRLLNEYRSANAVMIHRATVVSEATATRCGTNSSHGGWPPMSCGGSCRLELAARGGTAPELTGPPQAMDSLFSLTWLSASTMHSRSFAHVSSAARFSLS